MTKISPVDITPSASTTWQDKDISAHLGGDAGDVAGVLIEVVCGGTEYDIGFRKNGSTDSEVAVVEDNAHQWFWVGIDGDDILEVYAELYTGVTFYLMGYLTNAEAGFATNAIEVTPDPAANGTWSDVDISGDTGGDTAIAALLTIYQKSSYNNQIGLRKNGSTDTRTNDILVDDDFRGGLVGCDGSEIFEAFSDRWWTGSYEVKLLLQGWITDNATMVTNAVDYQEGTTGSYQDVDFSGDIPEGNTGAFFYLYPTDLSEPSFGIRENGDVSYDHYHQSAYFGCFGWTPIDGNRVAEQKISSNVADLYYLGYTSDSAGSSSSSCRSSSSSSSCRSSSSSSCRSSSSSSSCRSSSSSCRSSSSSSAVAGFAWGEQNPTGEAPESWSTFSDGGGGSPTIEGDADWGKVVLAPAAIGQGPVKDLGSATARTFTITQNKYGSGSGSATAYIRGDTSSFNQDDGAPAWEEYTAPVNRTWRYVQVKIVGD